jgi:hypothetical protein
VRPPALLDLPAAERDRIERQIADLWSVRNRLDDMITEARRPDSDCPCPPAEPLDGEQRSIRQQGRAAPARVSRRAPSKSVIRPGEHLGIRPGEHLSHTSGLVGTR